MYKTSFFTSAFTRLFPSELNGTTLTLYFDQLEPVGGKKATDINKATLDSNGKITSFKTTGGSYYLIACSGGDFILEG